MSSSFVPEVCYVLIKSFEFSPTPEHDFLLSYHRWGEAGTSERGAPKQHLSYYSTESFTEPQQLPWIWGHCAHLSLVIILPSHHKLLSPQERWALKLCSPMWRIGAAIDPEDFFELWTDSVPRLFREIFKGAHLVRVLALQPHSKLSLDNAWLLLLEIILLTVQRWC